MEQELITKIIQLIAATVGSAGFGMVFNIPKEKMIPAVIGGFVSWLSYLIFIWAGCNEYLSGFLAAALTTAYAEIAARLTRAPAIMYIVVGTVPLIPGAGLYRSMFAMLRMDMAAARQQGIYALLFASAMAAGIVLTTLVDRLYRQHRKIFAK